MLTTRAVLADRLRGAVGRLARRLRQQALGGLTPSQATVLGTLYRQGPMTMGRLAECERISRPSATGIVKRMIEKGLVERRQSDQDGRSAIVQLTPAGVDLLEARRKERTAYLSTRIDRLDPDDVAVLERAVDILERMIEE